MSTLVVDIETVGYEWNQIPEASRKSLSRWTQQAGVTDEEERKLLEKVKSKLALSPLTGQIVSLAMYDVERDLGAVYFVSDKVGESFQDDSFTYKQRTEKEILEDFWEGVKNYDVFVTFNGRSFAVPFLYHRSIITKVRPSVEISMKKYVSTQNLPYQVDLLEELTFHGSLKPRPSLQLLAVAYGIDYRPEMDGSDVGEFFRQKKFTDIAKRSATDVLAIKSLYEIWKTNLAPRSFLNSIEM